MSLSRKIAYNTAVQIAGKAVSTILGLVAVAMITREIGASGFGVYTTATAFLQFFGLTVDLGLTLTLASVFGKPETNRQKVLSAALGFRLISGILFFGAAPLIALLFPYSGDIKLGIAIAAISFFANAFVQLLSALFQANLRMDYVAIAETASRVALIAGVIASGLLGYGITGIFIALVLSNIVNLGVTLIFARTLTPLGLSFDLAQWKPLLKASWPIAISVALNLIYLRADVLILSLNRSQIEVGLYGAAYRVIDVLTTLPVLFMGLVLPLLSHAWASGEKLRFARMYQRSFDALIMLSFPIVLGAQFVATPLMSLLAGSEFAASGAMLKILIFALGFLFIGSLPLYTVVAIEKQKKVLWAFGGSALVSLILYVALIPRYGALAAASVTVFSELFVTIAALYLIKREAGVSLNLGVAGRIMLSLIPMSAALALTSRFHVLFGIAVATLTYGAGLIIFRAVTPQTIKDLLKLRQSKPVEHPHN